MKKFLKQIVVAAGFMSLFYVFAIGVIGLVRPEIFPNLPYFQGKYGHMYTRSNEAVKYSGVDILFMGSSRAYRGFDTRIFESHGLDVFNFGSSAQTPVQTLALAKQYLDTLNPKLVVIEVFPSGFASDGVESSVDILSNNRIDCNVVEMAFKVNHIKVYNVMVLAILKQVLGIDADFQERPKKDGDTYVSGGFVEKEFKYNRALKPPNKRNLDFEPFQKKAFKELLNLLKEKEIEFLLVEAPSTTVRYQSISNHKELESFLTAHGTYLNFNERLQLNDSLHFYDQSHLNQDGVEIFNTAFIDWLREKGYYDQLTLRESIKN